MSMAATSSCILGIDEDDEHEEEDEEGVSLLEVGVPQCLCHIREAVAGEQTTQLRRTENQQTYILNKNIYKRNEQ